MTHRQTDILTFGLLGLLSAVAAKKSKCVVEYKPVFLTSHSLSNNFTKYFEKFGEKMLMIPEPCLESQQNVLDL